MVPLDDPIPVDDEQRPFGGASVAAVDAVRAGDLALRLEVREQREVEAAIGVSRVTMNRMLDDLEEYGWLTRTNRTDKHRITPCGRLVIDEVAEALDATATSRKLRDIQEYLPTEEFDFDLRRLGSARITRPTATDTVAPLRRSATLMSESAERFNQLVATSIASTRAGLANSTPPKAPKGSTRPR